MADLRMPDLNKIFIAGNLTRDPELQYLQSGTGLCKFGLAVNRRYRTKEGEQREETFFINVTVWGKSAEYCGQNLKKGKPVLIEGRLQGNEWEDKTTGQKRTSLDIVADRVSQLSWEDRPGGPSQPRDARPIEEPAAEDDIPF